MQRRTPKALDQYQPASEASSADFTDTEPYVAMAGIDRTGETRVYADGTAATGTAPLPDQSPAEQDALTRHVSNIMDLAKARALPELTVADLDEGDRAMAAVAAAPGCIEAFKDADGRTMQVCGLPSGELRKVAGTRGSYS